MLLEEAKTLYGKYKQAFSESEKILEDYSKRNPDDLDQEYISLLMKLLGTHSEIFANMQVLRANILSTYGVVLA